jgi:hypothetical protein
MPQRCKASVTTKPRSTAPGLRRAHRVPDDLATALGDERPSGQPDARQDVEHGVCGAEATAEEALKRRLAREGVERARPRSAFALSSDSSGSR